jgi:hypothetical protein
MFRILIQPLRRILCGLCLLAAAETGAQASSQPQVGPPIPSKPGPADPFLAGALGVIPFMSGFYITEKWERGVVFSLVDVLLVLGIFSARDGEQQKEGNARIYYGLIAANNVADALLSMRQASGRTSARLHLRPEGALEVRLAWTY